MRSMPAAAHGLSEEAYRLRGMHEEACQVFLAGSQGGGDV